MGNVNITYANGGLGTTLQTEDGITGLIVTLLEEEGSVTMDTVYLLTGMKSLEALGITKANNPLIVKQVGEFYDEVGDGALLYLLPASTDQGYTSIVDYGNDTLLVRLLTAGNGTIRLVGIVLDDEAVLGESYEVIGFNSYVSSAISVLNDSIQELRNRHNPIRAILGATSYQGAYDDVPNITTGTTDNGVSVVLGDTKAGNGAAVGLALGRLAGRPVHEKISRVRTGQLNITEAYMGSDPLEEKLVEAAIIAGRGYITWQTYPNVAGYYFSGDPTASATTDDYHWMARGRVIDKAHIIAYTTFVQEVDDSVEVNEDGTIKADYCKWLEARIENAINLTMKAGKEISSVQCVINPNQNILSTDTLNVQLRIVPVGYNTTINVDLGFSNPALSS